MVHEIVLLLKSLAAIFVRLCKAQVHQCSSSVNLKGVVQQSCICLSYHLRKIKERKSVNKKKEQEKPTTKNKTKPDIYCQVLGMVGLVWRGFTLAVLDSPTLIPPLPVPLGALLALSGPPFPRFAGAACTMNSGTPLLWTPWGPGKVSCIQWNPSIVDTLGTW